MEQHTDPITGRHTANGIGPDDQVRNTRTGQTGTVTFASLEHDAHVNVDGMPADRGGPYTEIWKLGEVEKIDQATETTAASSFWTVRYTDHGEHVRLELMPEGKAKALLDGVRKYIDPDAVLVDVVTEISARLPVGSRIRHTVQGWTGTVVCDEPGNAPFPRVPAGVPLAYVPTNRYTAVCVRFDHRQSPEWFDTEFIEPEG